MELVGAISFSLIGDLLPMIWAYFKSKHVDGKFESILSGRLRNKKEILIGDNLKAREWTRVEFQPVVYHWGIITSSEMTKTLLFKQLVQLDPHLLSHECF